MFEIKRSWFIWAIKHIAEVNPPFVMEYIWILHYNNICDPAIVVWARQAQARRLQCHDAAASIQYDARRDIFTFIWCRCMTCPGTLHDIHIIQRTTRHFYGVVCVDDLPRHRTTSTQYIARHDILTIM